MAKFMEWGGVNTEQCYQNNAEKTVGSIHFELNLSSIL